MTKKVQNMYFFIQTPFITFSNGNENPIWPIYHVLLDLCQYFGMIFEFIEIKLGLCGGAFRRLKCCHFGTFFIFSKGYRKNVILNPVQTLIHRLIMFCWTFCTTSVWFLNFQRTRGSSAGPFRGPIFPFWAFFDIFIGKSTKLQA